MTNLSFLLFFLFPQLIILVVVKLLGHQSTWGYAIESLPPHMLLLLYIYLITCLKLYVAWVCVSIYFQQSDLSLNSNLWMDTLSFARIMWFSSFSETLEVRSTWFVLPIPTCCFFLKYMSSTMIDWSSLRRRGNQIAKYSKSFLILNQLAK